MQYSVFKREDIPAVIPLYISYFNNCEDGEWTEETVSKRLSQMISREDSYGIILRDYNDIIGFALGYFEQFDDGKTYNLIEIVIAEKYQDRGLGTRLMQELENRVREMGAFMVSLQAVNDERHDRFYSRLGYGNCSNFIIKVKML